VQDVWGREFRGREFRDFLAPATLYARLCGPQDVSVATVRDHKRCAFMRGSVQRCRDKLHRRARLGCTLSASDVGISSIGELRSPRLCSTALRTLDAGDVAEGDGGGGEAAGGYRCGGLALKDKVESDSSR
jgi:hypothetical protein